QLSIWEKRLQLEALVVLSSSISHDAKSENKETSDFSDRTRRILEEIDEVYSRASADFLRLAYADALIKHQRNDAAREFCLAKLADPQLLRNPRMATFYAVFIAELDNKEGNFEACVKRIDELREMGKLFG